MEDIIHLLPDSVANQIAAGEVVQRPSSVVKELVENAIDAGATKVQVIVTDGGRTLIQVIDNGKGMSGTDARLAFERHATSKIASADDLFALTTMGFRGEALASIVAVAQVELVTRRADDELGTCILISGSKYESQEPVAAPVGSNFKVKNLFFNIPARRKFLKSVQTELNNIVTEFERVALVNCDVEFSLSHNGNEMISLPPSSFRQRIVNLFGKRINSQLIEVDVMSSLINIKGFVGAPESAKKKGALQYFFVNGRYMRHPYFAKAVAEAYGEIIPQGEQVPFFLCFDVDPSRIDVNIHPTKTEIKFEDEFSLWKIISAAVKESLGRFNAAPSLDFDDDAIPDIPVMDFLRISVLRFRLQRFPTLQVIIHSTSICPTIGTLTMDGNNSMRELAVTGSHWTFLPSRMSRRVLSLKNLKRMRHWLRPGCLSSHRRRILCQCRNTRGSISLFP